MSSINNLKTAINQALNSEFPNTTICDEDIKQGFEKPCFFIKVLSSTQKKEINRRYRKAIYFDINYFPDEENINNNFSNMADKLYEVFEYVKVNNNLYRASEMEHKVIDGVLHFFFKFNYYVFKEVDREPKMKKLIKGAHLKHGE